jgi:hypothetical protein
MPTASDAGRAIGIVRVSQTKRREGESYVSPADQRERIRAACATVGAEQLCDHDGTVGRARER